MKCFHHNDLDGRCAAAIVRRARPNSTESDFIEMDYKTTPDFSVVEHGEEVFIVDFSFKPPVMGELLAKTREVIWIDHHSTAAEYPYADFGLAGLRDFTVKGLSGCELTWKFLFPSEELPDAVQLIGDYDSWRMQLAPDCLEFYEGMKLESNPPCDSTWVSLFFETSEHEVIRISDNGKACIKYRDAYCQEMRKSFGYETELQGLKAYALNVYRFGSQAYGDLIEQYPVVIAYVHDGCQFTVSLYSTKDDVHCGEICKHFGGGGHKGAAGFVCKELPF